MRSSVVKVSLDRVIQMPVGLIQQEADLRGHGNATHFAGVAAGIGAMLGSFWGAGGVLIGASAFGLIGYMVGNGFDENQ